MTVLLKQAISPNLVQTLENNPAIIHGGPFANIAHGCNSVIATRTALKLADYVVTEAGFGADLGAEKFIDIKCRKAGFRPAAAVIVATVRALKYHGGVAVADVGREDLVALRAGLVNLERHVDNMRNVFGLPCVVAVNHRAEDTDAELAVLASLAERKGVKVVPARHFAQGGRGAADLAREVVALCAERPIPELRFAYADDDSLWDKVCAVARKIYGAAEVTADKRVRAEIERLQGEGYGRFPVCIAKTQYSFSTDPTLRGAPSGHSVNVREIRLAAGAGFIVVICGDVMTMPGLPRAPAAARIDIDAHGEVVGLS
jgi:formate--tetrahydrofolate ligase